MKQVELRELVESQELDDRINKLLCLIQEEEPVEITNQGKVVAQLVPEHEPKQSREQDIQAFWEKIDRLAVEIGAHWKDDMDAVEAVRDVRRDL